MSTLEQVELEIANAKQFISLKESLALLKENKYFKEIILEGYFKQEANRLVMLKVKDLPEISEKSIDRMLIGISALNEYFDEIYRRGIQMESELKNYEDTREEILTEEIA